MFVELRLHQLVPSQATGMGHVCVQMGHSSLSLAVHVRDLSEFDTCETDGEKHCYKYIFWIF